MRLIIVVVGIVVLLMGTVWAFQGAGYLLGSFMSNDPTWLYIGAVTAVVGVVLAILGFRSKPAKKSGP